MNNKLLVAVTVAALSAGTYVGSALALGTGYTFGAGVVASPHNMNEKLATKDSAERVCAFCHTSRIVAMSFCEPRSWTRVLSS